MTPDQRNWILTAAGEASEAKHAFPRMAACEAALESNYGTSALARLGLNLFGMKQHVHAVYGTLNLPTREFENGEWVPQFAQWVEYPNLADCFADRMATLVRLSNMYPEYQAALTAPDETVYITQVSKRWSTDPARTSKVIAIYGEVFPPDSNHDAVQDAVTAT